MNKILSAEMEKAIALIEGNRDRIDGLVEALLAKNHLTGSKIREIFEEKIP